MATNAPGRNHRSSEPLILTDVLLSNAVFPNTQYLLCLCRQAEPPPFALAHDIVIEKVHIKQGLQNSTKVHDIVMAVSSLVICPVNPVHNVKGAIQPHKEDVIASQVLYITITLKYN
jgi:hypothetical protein